MEENREKQTEEENKYFDDYRYYKDWEENEIDFNRRESGTNE